MGNSFGTAVVSRSHACLGHVLVPRVAPLACKRRQFRRRRKDLDNGPWSTCKSSLHSTRNGRDPCTSRGEKYESLEQGGAVQKVISKGHSQSHGHRSCSDVFAVIHWSKDIFTRFDSLLELIMSRLTLLHTMRLAFSRLSVFLVPRSSYSLPASMESPKRSE